jgi:hypothetical protein
MIVVLFVNADVPIMGIVVVNTPTVAGLELDVGSTSGDLHQAAGGTVVEGGSRQRQGTTRDVYLIAVRLDAHCDDKLNIVRGSVRNCWWV